MRKFLLILLLVICIYVFFQSRSSSPRQEYLVTPKYEIQSPVEETPHPPFAYGERFAYIYTMGPLRTGSAKLTFVDEVTIDGKGAYLVKFESEVGTYYDLENIYAEKTSLYPIYIERNIKNLGFATTIKEVYDQKACEVEITKHGILGTRTAVIKKQGPIHNALLLIYYCRKLPSSDLKPGYEFDIVLPVDEFKVTLARTEKIKVPAGSFEAYLFESNPEKMKLWIAKDEKRTPLKMENMTSFGPSSIVLEEYH